MISGELVTLLLGLAGVAATIYGTRSSREAAREASADTGIRETLKAAVEVNQKTYETLAAEQKLTIERLEAQLTAFTAKISDLEETVESQRLTIEALRRELEGRSHGSLAD